MKLKILIFLLLLGNNCLSQCASGIPISTIYINLEVDINFKPVNDLLNVRINNSIEKASKDGNSNIYVLSTKKKVYSDKDIALDAIPGYTIEKVTSLDHFMKGNQCCAKITFHISRRYVLEISLDDPSVITEIRVNNSTQDITRNQYKFYCLKDTNNIIIDATFKRYYPYRHYYSVKENINKSLPDQTVISKDEVVNYIINNNYNSAQKSMLASMFKKYSFRFIFNLGIDNACK